MNANPMNVLYEDNHIIVVAKAAGEIVQGDKTGDAPLTDAVKAYIKEHRAEYEQWLTEQEAGEMDEDAV